MNKIYLFDVDGTICESGKKITCDMASKINNLTDNNIEVGIVGGGTFEKIIYQLDNLVYPKYIFSECGSVYHILNSDTKIYTLIHKNNIRLENEYKKINILIKACLKFLSEVDYNLSGNFIDLRNGLIYVSLIGMVATDKERAEFTRLDNICHYRDNLIELLKNQTLNLNII